MDLTGKVAIITGSSSGIGATTAKHFAKLGASIIITGRDEKNLQKVQAECIENGSDKVKVTTPIQIEANFKDLVLYHVGDIIATGLQNLLVETAIEKFGKLDVLVNNAAIAATGIIQDSPIEIYDNVFNINVRSVVQMTKLCIPHLIKSKGSIINVSSIAGIRPIVNAPYYSMSKAALDHLTKSLALELAPHGIRVNSVNPGYIDTPIHQRTTKISDEQAEKLYEFYVRRTPMQRIGDSMEVAKAIAFLVSDDSSFTTGQTFVADGGLILASPK